MAPENRWNLGRKIVLTLAALTTVGVLATAAVFYSALSREVSRFEQDRLLREVDLLALDWEARWRAVGENSTFLAGTPPVLGLERARRGDGVDPIDGSTSAQWAARLEGIFAAMMASHSDYAQVRLVGFADGGREWVRVERSSDRSGVRVVRDDELQRKGDEPYMARARAAANSDTRTAFFSDVTLNRENGRVVEPVMPMVRAMSLARRADGTPFGVVVVNKDLRETMEAQTAGLGPGRRMRLTNRRGQVLYDSREGVGFAFEFGDDPGILQDSPALSALVADDDASPAVPGEVARAVRFPGGGDPFMAVQLLSEAAGQPLARSTLVRALPPIAVVLLLTVGIGLYLGRRATRPFMRLSQDIGEAGEAGASASIPVPSTPEAAQVARAFNRAQLRLARIVGELERSNRDLREFAALASHDLQEPARTMRSFAQLLEEDYGPDLDDNGREMLGFLSAAGARMQDQIREVLAYSRIGKDPEVTAVDLSRMMELVEADLAEAIAESGASMEWGVLPTVEGSATELRLLLQNLVSNAIKFRRRGAPPRIRIEQLPGEPVHIVVRDDGIGIPGEARERVFDLFRRERGAGPDATGSGIGLAHCRKIVEGHGGRIWIGDPESGTEVHFTLAGRGGPGS